jgi:hypothetical protein
MLIKEQLTRRELFSEIFSRKTLKRVAGLYREVSNSGAAAVSKKIGLGKDTKSLFETVRRLNAMNNRKEG